MHIAAPARAGRREWIGLGVFGLPTAVLSMDLTVLHLAAPSLSADLEPTGTQLLWILDIYGFLVAGFLLVMGSLGDRIGRRRLLLAGAASFAGASVLAAFAPTAEALIAARALLGIAGATLMPSALALLADLFRAPAQRTFAIACWMTCFTAGEAVGPLVGGALLQYFWWGAIFLAGVPVMLLLLAAGPFLLPEHTDRLGGRLDIPSAVLLLTAVLPLVYGVKSFASSAPLHEAAAWSLLGLTAGSFFVRRQLRLAAPLMDVRLFRLPAFSAGLATQVFAVAAMAGCQLLVLQHLQVVLGLPPLAVGLWTVPSIALGILATLGAPRLVRHVRPAAVIAGGLGAAAAGAAVVASTAYQADLASTLVGFTVLYTGVTPTLVLVTDLIVKAAPRQRAGMASSVAETGAEFGLAGGMAFLGAAAMWAYQAGLTASAPAGVAPGALAAAGETAGAGVETAQGMHGELGTALLSAVQGAFAGGVELAAWAGAAVLAAAAALAWVFLRGEPPSGALGEPEGERPPPGAQQP